MRTCTVFILLFILLTGKVLSQNQAEVTTPSKIAYDFGQLLLPPLDTLFKNATKDPTIKYFENQQKIQESQLKTTRRDWLKYLNAGANYQYGNGRSGSTNDASDIYQYSSSKQNWYSVGASLSLPISDILDRNNRIKRQKLQIESTKDQIQSTYNQKKEQIIELYTQAEQLLHALKLKAEGLSFANAQFLDAKNDFINNKITSQQLNTQKGIQLQANQDYYKTKSSLKQTLLKLEIISNTKIFNQQ